ncbi:uncharacterized protein LOC119022406 isoform X2 [Acanthopagrus latus]|uniref:uncharacterized protein LOC119022406 isoform X2 n=1 Tax=Acanthopagrus latus TaxID=8177 RepID=UPI00187C015B|nr:uncharacterized protein LOC119022406 isoform X2 [Acanthopagrus latus]XP_036959157.1 uncharacterized protein LOC119022406 isoform X2 [Acanthopagrus latus]XP_036959168.1 uncharacterized protein LOC119022406 isoform X2 [Acanthopagrus latus]
MEISSDVFVIPLRNQPPNRQRGSGELKLFGRFNVQHSFNNLHMVNDDLVLRQQTLTHALHHRFCINQEASFYRGFAMGKDQEIFHDLPEVAPLCFGGQLLMEELIQSVIRLLSLKLVITLDELLQDSIKGSLMYGARFHEDLKNSVSSWAPSPGKGLIIFGYVSGEDSEDRRSAAFIQMDGTMQLSGYISAFCTQGH